MGLGLAWWCIPYRCRCHLCGLVSCYVLGLRVPLLSLRCGLFFLGIAFESAHKRTRSSYGCTHRLLALCKVFTEREREREREREGGSETLQKQPIFPLCVCSFFCSAKLTKRRSSVKSGGGRTCGGAEERIIRNLNLVLTKQNYTHTHTHNRHLACSLAATSSSRRMRASSEALRTR